MAREFMARLGNRADRVRHPLGNPAEREERRLDARPIEQGQDTLHIAFDAQFAAIPVAARDRILERADLEPVLDINRQAVDDRSPGWLRLGGGREIHAQAARLSLARPSLSSHSISSWSR